MSSALAIKSAPKAIDNRAGDLHLDGTEAKAGINNQLVEVGSSSPKSRQPHNNISLSTYLSQHRYTSLVICHSTRDSHSPAGNLAITYEHLAHSAMREQ